MGRLTTKDCKSVEGENLKLVVNSTSDDAMVLELHNSNYNTEKWGKIKTFVMLLMFIGLSSSLNISNIVILIIATILLLVNLYLILQLVDKGDNERQIDVESESNPFSPPSSRNHLHRQEVQLAKDHDQGLWSTGDQCHPLR